MNKYTQIFFLIYFLFFTFSINASTYYVSQKGSNKNPGTSWNEAWRTLKFASNELFPGDTLIIRQGDKPYNYLPVVRSGEKDNPITIKGEFASAPPVLTGAVIERNWQQVSDVIWKAKTTAEPRLVVENGITIVRASSKDCNDGNWFWKKDVFYYKPTHGVPAQHVLWRTSMGGGVQIGNNSWINIENISCWLGKGACVSIGKGRYNIVNNIYSKWYVHGIQIRGGVNNYVENCFVEENKEGIYLLAGASYNEIRNCKAMRNGNYPIWVKGDRAGIAIGAFGINVGNKLIGNEVAFNGGVNSDPGLIVYKAPDTIIHDNFIHDNYGSGVFITINSDGTRANNNIVSNNGQQAILKGGKNISGFSVRRSKNVVVKDNVITNNFVAKDKVLALIDVGPRGGLDLRGNKGDDMTNIKFINNIVCGTKNGPNLFVSDIPITDNTDHINNYFNNTISKICN